MKTMFWILKINLALLFFCTLASGQTPDGLESQYGKPFNAFEIRPGIMLQIQKDNQGQITEMRIEPFSGAETSIHLDPSMEAYVVKEIIDELIPVEERGSRGEFFGLTLYAGGAWSATYDYEFVSINLLGSTKLQSEQSPPKYKKDNPFQRAEVIKIKWKNR